MKLSLSPPRASSGARGEPSSGARVPVERTPAELARARSLVLSDAECDASAGASAPATAHFEPLVPDKNDFLARLVPPRLIGVGDRAGRGVAKECYLVDPASSHMLVSKIKPCMCKYELIQTVKLRMAH